MKAFTQFSTILLFAFLAACTCSSKSKVQTVTPIEVEGLLRNGFAVLVDVREQDEVRQGMVASANWMPLGKIEADSPEWRDFLSSIPKDKTVVFYCRSGRRSGIAADKTAQKGYRTANMGPFDAWVKAGLPTRKGQ